MNQESLQKALVKYSIPSYMHDGLINYILHGQRQGDFMSAVLSNDLSMAVYRADGQNLLLLHKYMMFLHWETPINCYGSPEHYADWVKAGGWYGIMQAHEAPQNG